MTKLEIGLLSALIAWLLGVATERFRSSMWERQERWKYKRDLYEKLLGTLEQVHLFFDRVQMGRKISDEEVKRINDAAHEFARLRPTVAVALSKETIEAYDTLVAGAEWASDTTPLEEMKNPIAHVRMAQGSLSEALAAIIRSARKDLRF